MNTQSKLKPCPFCGAVDIQLKDMPIALTPFHKDNFKRNVWIDCADCPCSFHMQFEGTVKDWCEIFTAKWNERVKLSTIRKLTSAIHNDDEPKQTSFFGVA